MRLSGRLAAAIEILDEVETRHRPVSEALKGWGIANRFAGAGDRAAIGNLVYDALRRRASHAYAMGSDTSRALVLSVAVRDWGETAATLSAAWRPNSPPRPRRFRPRRRPASMPPIRWPMRPITSAPICPDGWPRDWPRRTTPAGWRRAGRWRGGHRSIYASTP